MTDHDPEIVIGLMALVLDVLEVGGPMSDADLATAVGAEVARSIVRDGSLEAAVQLAHRQGRLWRVDTDAPAAGVLLSRLPELL